MAQDVLSIAIHLLSHLSLGVAVVLVYTSTTPWTDRLPDWARRAVLGLSFGAAAVLASLVPVSIAPGVITSSAAASLGLGGLFGGWIGGLAAAAAGVAMRLAIGGPGAPAGTLSMTLSAAAGVLLSLWARRRGGTLGWRHLLVLGAAAFSSALASLVLVPASVRWDLVRATGLPLALTLMAAALLVGGVLLQHLRREEAQTRLAESERRFRSLTNNLPGCVFQLRYPPGRTSPHVDFISDGFEALAGLSPADAVAHPERVADRYVEDDIPARLESVRRSRETFTPWSHDFRLKHTDGSIRWLRSKATPTRVGGEVVWDGVAIDITEEKRREEELKRSRDLLAMITENVPAALFQRVVSADKKPRFTHYTGALLQRYGIAPDEMLAAPQKLLAIVHPDDVPLIVRAFDPANDDLQPRKFRLRTFTPEKDLVWVEIQSRAERRPDGSVIRTGVALDVTDLVRITDALTVTEQRLKVVAQNLPGTLYRMRRAPDGAISFPFLSEGFEALFGASAHMAELNPAVIQSMLLPEDERQRQRLVEQSARDLSLYERKFRIRRPDGSIRWVQARSMPHREADGSVVWDGLMTDITAQVLAEEEARRAERLLALGQLTGGVSHEFNNLLTIVSGNAEFLGPEVAHNPAAAESVRQIEAAVERGSRLVRELRAFAQRQTLSADGGNVYQVLAELAPLLGSTLGAGTKLELPRNGAPLQVHVDVRRLQMAILNLVLNARDAIEGEGRIAIEVADAPLDAAAAAPLGLAPGPYVRIDVRDNGKGMTPEVRARAVEPFFTTKDVGQGAGLGLSMVHGFVQQSGGRLDIASTPSQGTTVSLLLPAGRVEAAAG